MLCGGEGGCEGEKSAKANTCCKQSLEEGGNVSKKVHGCGPARAMACQIAQIVPDVGYYKGSYDSLLCRKSTVSKQW